MFIKLKYLFILLCLLGHGRVFAQNLVPNPSFEDTLSCPEIFSDITKCAYWFNAQQYSSADYYHTCSSHWSQQATIPQNAGGYQSPLSGNAYSGIVLEYTDLFTNQVYTEFLEVKLIEPLTNEKTYKITFYYSLAETYSSMLVTNMGVFFSSDSIASGYLNNGIVDTNTITTIDYANWHEFSVEYVANGEEKYLLIGNFNDSINTNRIINPQHQNAHTANRICYIYIDDVSVVDINSTGITSLNAQDKQLLKIVDVLGRETKEKKNTPLFYIYNNGTVEKKIIIE